MKPQVAGLASSIGYSVVVVLVIAAATCRGECPFQPPFPLYFMPPLPDATIEAVRAHIERTALGPCAAGPHSPSSTGVSGTIVYGDHVYFINMGCSNKLRPSENVTRDTIFRLASVSKVFATQAVLFAYEDKRIRSLDDEVRLYAPDFFMSNPFGVEQPTWMQMCAQVAGMVRATPCARNQCNVTTEQIFSRLSRMKLVMPPALRPSYSNVAFGVVGHVVAERLYHTTFESFLRENITKPLGMNTTGTEYTRTVLMKMATPYGADGNPAPFEDLGWEGPDGGIFSTASDFVKYIQFWLKGWRSNALYRENLQPRFLNTDRMSAFGAPWEIVFSNGYTVRTKDGDLPGYFADFALVPELNLGWAFFLNGDGVSMDLSQEIADIVLPEAIRGAKQAFLDTFRPQPAAVLEMLNGTCWQGNVRFKFYVHPKLSCIVLDAGLYGVFLTKLEGRSPLSFRLWQDFTAAGPSCMLTEFIAMSGEDLVFVSNTTAQLPSTFPSTNYTRVPCPP